MFQRNRIAVPVSNSPRNSQRKKAFASVRNSYSQKSNKRNHIQKYDADIYDCQEYMVDQKQHLLVDIFEMEKEINEMQQKIEKLEGNICSSVTNQENGQDNTSEGKTKHCNDSEKLISLQEELKELENELSIETMKTTDEYKEELETELAAQKNMLNITNMQIKQIKERNEESNKVENSDDNIFRKANLDNYNELISILNEKSRLLNEESSIYTKEIDFYEDEERNLEEKLKEKKNLEKRLAILQHTRDNRERELKKVRKLFDATSAAEEEEEKKENKKEDEGRKSTRVYAKTEAPDLENEKTDVKNKLSEVEEKEESQNNTLLKIADLTKQYNSKVDELNLERWNRYNESQENEEDNKDSLEKIKEIKDEIREIIKARNEILQIETEDQLETDEEELNYKPDRKFLIHPPKTESTPRNKGGRSTRRNKTEEEHKEEIIEVNKGEESESNKEKSNEDSKNESNKEEESESNKEKSNEEDKNETNKEEETKNENSEDAKEEDQKENNEEEKDETKKESESFEENIEEEEINFN